MAERETAREEGYLKTRDVAGLPRNLGQNHVPDPAPDLDLDLKTINMVGLSKNHGQNLGPDPEKDGKIMEDSSSHMSPLDTRRSQSQKTRGNAGLDPAQEREGKKAACHPKVHREFQAPVFHLLKTQNSHRPRKKKKTLLKAPSKKKKLLQLENRRLPFI